MTLFNTNPKVYLKITGDLILSVIVKTTKKADAKGKERQEKR